MGSIQKAAEKYSPDIVHYTEEKQECLLPSGGKTYFEL